MEASRLGRKFLFLFDFAFTDPRSARKAREAALAFIDTAIRPGDEVGVLSYSPARGLTIHEYLTKDHAKVRSIVDAFGLRSVVGRAESLTNFLYADELRLMDAPDLSQKPGVEDFYENLAKAQTAGVVDEGRRQGYVDQARQFAQTFANLARALRYVPGWKNMILFSSGISRVPDHRPEKGAGRPEHGREQPRPDDGRAERLRQRPVELGRAERVLGSAQGAQDLEHADLRHRLHRPARGDRTSTIRTARP